jgi:hypothetical protein
MLPATTRTLVASIVLLASCSGLHPGLLVVPGGSLQNGVVFHLNDVITGHPSTFTVTAVAVRGKQSDDASVDMWSAEGAQPLSYIRYGASYQGLKESQRPLPLKRGQRYEVFVYTGKGARSFDLFAFRVDENGNIRQAPWFQF